MKKENLMPKVAEMLGVEIGEEFKIQGFNPSIFNPDEKYVITKRGLAFSNSTKKHHTILSYLLVGEYTIQKLPTLTEDEKAMLRVYKKQGYEWIARDKDKAIFIFTEKPEKLEYIWRSGEYCELPENLFPFIKWSDTEPTKIDDLIKEEE